MLPVTIPTAGPPIESVFYRINAGNLSNNTYKYLGLKLTKLSSGVNIKLQNINYFVLVLAKICDIISSKIVDVRFMIVTNTRQLEWGNEIRKARGLHVQH